MPAATRTARSVRLTRETLALMEAVAAITLWGVSFISIKIALQDVSAVTLIVVRFTLGALIVGVAAWRRGEFRQLRPRDLPALATVGLVGIALQQFLQVTGQETADASVAAFLASTAPAFTVALAAVALREKPRAWQLSGVALATFGAVLVATNGNWRGVLDGDFGAPGNAYVLASSVVWAALTLLSKRAVHSRPALLVTAGMFTFGALFISPLFILEQGWRELATVTAAGWAAIVFTSVVCTAGAYLLNTHALKHVAASRVAVIQNLEPLSAVIVAGMVLGETITPAMVLGGAAILGGVYLSEREAPRTTPIAVERPAPALAEAGD